MVLTFFDIETTGFNFTNSDVLQVGFVRADEKGKIINAGNLYFYQPGFDVERPDAFKVHGLTREFLSKYEADFKKNVAGLYAMLQKGYLVGKNSDSFDVPFTLGWINKVCPGYLPNITPFRTCDVQKVMKPVYQEAYRKQFGNNTSKIGTLEDYVKVLGIESFVKEMYQIAQGFAKEPAREGFHDALYDSVATYCVWLICRENNWVSL